jgi:hypothetical protein
MVDGQKHGAAENVYCDETLAETNGLFFCYSALDA